MLILKLLMRLTRHVPPVHRYLERQFQDLTSDTVVAFINHVDRLYPLLQYINRNETAWNIILVHCIKP